MSAGPNPLPVNTFASRQCAHTRILTLLRRRCCRAPTEGRKPRYWFIAGQPIWHPPAVVHLREYALSRPVQVALTITGGRPFRPGGRRGPTVTVARPSLPLWIKSNEAITIPDEGRPWPGSQASEPRRPLVQIGPYRLDRRGSECVHNWTYGWFRWAHPDVLSALTCLGAKSWLPASPSWSSPGRRNASLRLRCATSRSNLDSATGPTSGPAVQ